MVPLFHVTIAYHASAWTCAPTVIEESRVTTPWVSIRRRRPAAKAGRRAPTVAFVRADTYRLWNVATGYETIVLPFVVLSRQPHETLHLARASSFFPRADCRKFLIYSFNDRDLRRLQFCNTKRTYDSLI